jgi:hypothetical protein
MKKILLFLAAMILAMGSSASVQVKSQRALKNHRPFLLTRKLQGVTALT